MGTRQGRVTELTSNSFTDDNLHIGPIKIQRSAERHAIACCEHHSTMPASAWPQSESHFLTRSFIVHTSFTQPSQAKYYNMFVIEHYYNLFLIGVNN